MDVAVRLTDKERQLRGLDLLGRDLAAIVNDKMTRAAQGKPWVELYEAKETARRGHPYRVDPHDPRALLRILRYERTVFPEIDASQRAWIDELVQSSNRAAHTIEVRASDADRALDTMIRLADSLAMSDTAEALTELLVASATAPASAATDSVDPGQPTEESEEPAPARSTAGSPRPATRVPGAESPGRGVRGLSTKVDDLEIVVAYWEAVNYALVHNGVSPIVAATVRNVGPEVIRDVSVTISIESLLPESPVASPLTVEIGDVLPGSALDIPASRLAWRLSPAPFVAFDEAVGAEVTLTVQSDRDFVQDTSTVRLLTADEWWARSIPEALAAFVRPNDPAIARLLESASTLLVQRTGSGSFEGYQSGPERVHQIAEAIYDALVGRGIRYVEAPPSFEHTGQRIRSHSEVMEQGAGNCLDLACLYAAALEHAGINPVLVLLEGHAFAGFLTDDSQLPSVSVTATGSITTIVDSDLFDAVETTAVCTRDVPVTFDQARGMVRSWWTADLQKVDYLLDVHAAHRIVKPLPTIRTEGGVRVVEVEREAPVAPARRIPAAAAVDGMASEEPARIARWRRALLDMSYVNPLLKLKKASSVDLHVPAQSLPNLEDLVASGTQLELQAHDELAELHRAQGARTAAEVDPVAVRRILLEESRLFAALTRGEYHRRLRNLARKAKVAAEETGTSSLYLALGTLEWKERAKEGRAPLFLIPVQLTGGRGDRRFLLELDPTREVEPNYCLIEKLRVTWGLEIPQLTDPGEDESGLDVEGALASIRSGLLRAGMSDFHVEETAHLTLLHFSTLEMWRDLTANWRAFVRRPAVRHLVETPGMPFVDAVEPPQPDATAEATTYLPIPADGSQIEAVRWAATGRSFILEGPPGTGKSQTITNLMAHLMAEGKKVLFVAEKQAALEVVKKRLDAVGLGPFSLDVHGRNQTVTAVREQISAALDASAPSDPGWESARSAYRTLVESLSQYPSQLHEPGPADLSAWDARQVVLEIRESADQAPAVDVPRSVVMERQTVERVHEAARDLGASLLQLSVPPAASPWRLAGPVSSGELDRRTVGHALDDLRTAESALPSGPLREVVDRAVRPAQFEALETWLRTAKYGSAWTAEDARAIVTPQWRSHAAEAHRALEHLRQTVLPRLTPFAPAAIGVDVDDLLARSVEIDKRILGKKKRRQQLLTEVASVMAVQPDSVPLKSLTEAIQRLHWARGEVGKLVAYVTQVPGVALALPHDWNPLDDGQAGALVRAMTGITAAYDLGRAFADDGADVLALVDQATRAALQSGDPRSLPEPELVTAVASAWSRFTASIGTTSGDLRFWMGDRTRGEAVFADLPAWTADASGGAFIRLGRWLGVRHALERLRELGVTSVDSLVRKGSLRGADAETAVRLGVAGQILAERLDSTGLTSFDEADRRRLTERFVATGEDIRTRMIAELPARIVAARSFDPNQRVGTVAELRQQLSRRRGGLTIRQLLHRFGSIITQVTPCFLMSPTSVARFLPAEGIDFDVVVFDEASQIRVPEAIGAMGRGRSVVIVGDSQQMPPTAMFATSSPSDDDETVPEDDLPVPKDLESILTEAVESRLDRLLLTWHYRSRDESLIAFSNHTYYEGRLSTFPTPPERHGARALTLRRVDGEWEGGGRSAARVNRAEAHAIVDEICTLVTEQPDRSIGVVTFNTQQRDLIQDLLDDLRERDRAVEAAMSREEEPLFVKNLENVQGDERDVILFTLAFARDASGKVPLNWGPLSRAGGQKRLNVAITRAKERVVIFASFDPHDLDLTNSRSEGLAHLKDYLLLAKHGTEQAALRRAGMRDRHLEQVASSLRDAGLEVRTNVGLSDFTVDLAVRAGAGRPWIAVLLDHRAWADRASVGDRDGLPRQVLVESMGWARVERIWMPTWVRDPKEVVDEIVAAARAAEPSRQHPSGPAHPQVVTTDPAPLTVASSTTMSIQSQVSATPSRSTVASTVSTANELPPGVTAFRAASDSPRYASTVLDETGRRSGDLVRAELRDVVLTEAPILLDRLLKIVAARFGISRLRESRRKQLLSYVPRQAVDRAANGDLVVWVDPVDVTRFTGYRVAVGEKREITDVPYPEIRNAMVSLARRAHGMHEEDLLRETAREFGVLRLASRVRPRLEAVLSAALDDGALSRRETRIEPGSDTSSDAATRSTDGWIGPTQRA